LVKANVREKFFNGQVLPRKYFLEADDFGLSAYPSRRKKATPKRSGFSHLFSAKKYLETRYGQHLPHFNMVRVVADERLVGVVYLVPLSGVAVVVFSNFGEGITAHYGIRVPGSFWFGIAEKIGATSRWLCRGLNRLLFAFVADKIEESHGFDYVK
jgi:hypothetical protein